MRHRKREIKLSRPTAHRKALRKNMALSLLEHERIITTQEKAKFVQPFVERLITLAKEPSDHHHKMVFSRIQCAQRIKRSVEDERGKGTVEISSFGVRNKKGERLERRDRRMIKKLFEKIGPMFKDRQGGYTRILRLAKNRLGDNASRVIFELVQRTDAPAPDAAAPEAAAAKTKDTATATA